ncbi:MAG: SH3 domain-containing protein, partial [Chloroflexia bacterium]
RDRLMLIGFVLLLLIAAAVAASLIMGRKPAVVLNVTPTATAKPIPSPTGFGDPTETPVPQPTATAVPPPPTDIIAVNGWVQVTANVRLRSEASTSGQVLGTLKQGTNGHVIEGPVVANGYTWWKIDSYDGTNPAASGWCAGEFLKPIPAP